MSERINQVAYQSKVFRGQLRFTSSGKAVWNAGTSMPVMVDEEWHPCWFEVTAWQDLAEQIANDVNDGDEIVMRGRSQAQGYRNREGDVITKPGIVLESYEVVARNDRAPSKSAPPAADDDLPF